MLYEIDDAGRVVGLACDPAREECGNAPTHVEEWRVKLIPIRDVGTDRNAALNFADHRYDASRLGWTPDELRKLCVADSVADTIDPTSISAVVGLNIMSTAITNRYFEKHRPASREEFLKYMGFGVLDYPRTDPEQLKNYKSRPLHGIWATPPFLHNGSVRTVYQMISPRSERQSAFWSGTKEYDPVHLGYEDREVPGAVRFDTAVTGNDNTGHEFRDGCQKNGVIGPYLEPEERFQILEYLKLMDYVKPEEGDENPYELSYGSERRFADFYSRPVASESAFRERDIRENLLAVYREAHIDYYVAFAGSPDTVYIERLIRAHPDAFTLRFTSPKRTIRVYRVHL